MRVTLLSLPVLALLLMAAGDRPLYRDASRPVEERIEDLLARMTLEEKVGQLNMPCLYEQLLGPDISSKMTSCRRFAEGTYNKDIGPGGGFFTLADNVLEKGSAQQAEFFNELQKIAIEKTRLGIPLIQTEEGTHGVMCSGKTIFPEGLAIGSTWNPSLVRSIYSTAAREARAVGIHQLYTLVIEPNRDPRLGRNEEGYSEDAYLCSRIAEAIVHGAQGGDVSAPDKVVAGLCHFPGQGQPVSGFERGSMEISERMLREVFLPPWEAGIKRAGALGVMATYPAIDGVPTHASSRLLTTLLREELGFRGLVLSEGGGLSTLVYERLAATQKEAGQMALRAGVDVDETYEDGYLGPLVESVKEGKVPMADVDRAVRRVLRQKFALGLFERPYVDPQRAARVTHTADDQALALEVARQGIVLLKNDGLLPLKKDLHKIAVIGPNADDLRNQLGDYTSRVIPQPVVTVLGGIRGAVAPRTEVVYAKGCGILGDDKSGFAEAERAARGADVAIVVVGEAHGTVDPTNGESYDVASLDLTGVQEDLVKAVYGTGTPTIVVLINGRPLSVRWIAEHAPALVEAWCPGERGGTAVADVLFGDTNPSGRLSITIPRHVGQLPAYYNARPSKRYWLKEGSGKRYVELPGTPLYEFGYGLSYTQFDYSNLRVEPAIIAPDGVVTVSVDVRNSGRRAGSEVVQLYLNDVLASISRPLEELRGFEKIALSPGETRTVRFRLGPDELSLLDRDLKRVVEPGKFRALIGHSSADIRVTGEFEVRP